MSFSLSIRDRICCTTEKVASDPINGSTCVKRRHILAATGICETPAGGNVFGGASNRSPKGLDETPQSVKDEGRLKPPFAGNVDIPLAGARRLISARGKRVYSSCGDPSRYFCLHDFSKHLIFTSKVLRQGF